MISVDGFKERLRTDALKGIARVKFVPAKLEEWKRLTSQVMEIVRTKE